MSKKRHATQIIQVGDEAVFVGITAFQHTPCPEGERHKCEHVRLAFKSYAPLILKGRKCSNCGALAMSEDKYMKHYMAILNPNMQGNYPNLVRAIRQAARFKRRKSKAAIKRVPHEIPQYIRDAARHPYQGGRFSPR